MAAPTETSSNKMFGGYNKRYKHQSATLGCSMNFTVYFPPNATSEKVPILYWLSGLTCTDENFIMKSGGQRAAAKHGIAVVAPDTSPLIELMKACCPSTIFRAIAANAGAPVHVSHPFLSLRWTVDLTDLCKTGTGGLGVEGEADSWDFGVGAGFYLNAAQEKWKNWQMYDYITKELPALLCSHFSQLDTSRASISGHSMGGHGALIMYLKNPGTYQRFSPVANPSPTLWGIKAFTGYLGEDKSAWAAYDATELVKTYRGPKSQILIDQISADHTVDDRGDKDGFYIEKRLLPENFKQAAEIAGVPVNLRIQSGYDHSYYFIGTFIDDHISFHAQALFS